MNYMRNGCNHYKNNNIIVMKLCVINESILRFNCLVKKNRRKEKRKLLILRLSLRYFSKSTTA